MPGSQGSRLPLGLDNGPYSRCLQAAVSVVRFQCPQMLLWPQPPPGTKDLRVEITASFLYSPHPPGVTEAPEAVLCFASPSHTGCLLHQSLPAAFPDEISCFKHSEQFPFSWYFLKYTILSLLVFSRDLEVRSKKVKHGRDTDMLMTHHIIKPSNLAAQWVGQVSARLLGFIHYPKRDAR